MSGPEEESTEEGPNGLKKYFDGVVKQISESPQGNEVVIDPAIVYFGDQWASKIVKFSESRKQIEREAKMQLMRRIPGVNRYLMPKEPPLSESERVCILQQNVKKFRKNF